MRSDWLMKVMNQPDRGPWLKRLVNIWNNIRYILVSFPQPGGVLGKDSKPELAINATPNAIN